MRIKLTLCIALCNIFLSGCVTNPNASANQNQHPIVKADNPNSPGVFANAMASSKHQENTKAIATRSIAIEPQHVVASKADDVYVADNRKEPTGLLGKTLPIIRKKSKRAGSEMDYVNDYMVYDITDSYNSNPRPQEKIKLPVNVKIVSLSTDKPKNYSKVTETFALVRQEQKSYYFIDVLQITLNEQGPSGKDLSYDSCNIGVIGLFLRHDGKSIPEKGWTVVNGSFTPVKNISKLECDMGSGD